jgi:sec-independent protein translocase protein TatB
MFDFGFSEMLVIGLIALVVLGPERLPRVARQAGQWLGKLQRYVADVKTDISRQMELEELRSLQKEVTEAARDVEKSLRSTVADTKAELNSIAGSLDPKSSSGTGAGGAGTNAVTDSSTSTSGTSTQPETQTDWDRIYSMRRTRERLRERRVEREKSLGVKRPTRR